MSRTPNRVLAHLPAVSALCFAIAACTGNASTPQEQKPEPGMTPFCDLAASCQQIAAACMPKDLGVGPVHECHLTGMYYGIEADCQAKLTSCLSTCAAAPSLSDGPIEDLLAECRDAGAHAKTDAGSTPIAFPATPLLTFTSDAKDLTIELRTAPEQPIYVGPDGEGQLKITDTSSGAPVDGLEIAVTTLMPVMGHPCGPVAVKVEAQGQGVYLMTPFLASMKGACEVKLAITGPRSEHAVSPTFTVSQ